MLKSIMAVIGFNSDFFAESSQFKVRSPFGEISIFEAPWPDFWRCFWISSTAELNYRREDYIENEKPPPIGQNLLLAHIARLLQRWIYMLFIVGFIILERLQILVCLMFNIYIWKIDENLWQECKWTGDHRCKRWCNVRKSVTGRDQ